MRHKSFETRVAMSHARIRRDIHRGLMPWELVAIKMGERLGHVVTAQQCRAIEWKALKKLLEVIK